MSRPGDSRLGVGGSAGRSKGAAVAPGEPMGDRLAKDGLDFLTMD